MNSLSSPPAIALFFINATILFVLLLIYRQLRVKSATKESAALLSEQLTTLAEQRTEQDTKINSKLDTLTSDIGLTKESLSNTKTLVEAGDNRITNLFSELRKEIREAATSDRTESQNFLKTFQEGIHKQLDEMRKTVDERLQTTLEKRLSESFKQVSDRLALVHKGLGEMKTLASGVGDLKKVLTNVKTRGILGEYQLENILEQILTPEQYDKNVVTKSGSKNFVEFAIKMPGNDSQDVVWLPVDSKFPIESYDALLVAFDTGDKATIDTAQKELAKTVEKAAKDISSKYIAPPHSLILNH